MGEITQQTFPYDFDSVFRALLLVIPQIGFVVKTSDPMIGRITATTGMSALSYGETVTMIIERVDGDNTRLRVESSLRVGFNIAGAHIHARNFNAIIGGLSRQLQSRSGPGDAPPAAWHKDPLGRHQLRYWDGSAWTSHVSDNGTVSQDPI